jgi:hypothetical protein
MKSNARFNFVKSAILSTMAALQRGIPSASTVSKFIGWTSVGGLTSSGLLNVAAVLTCRSRLPAYDSKISFAGERAAPWEYRGQKLNLLLNYPDHILSNSVKSVLLGATTYIWILTDLGLTGFVGNFQYTQNGHFFYFTGENGGPATYICQ